MTEGSQALARGASHGTEVPVVPQGRIFGTSCNRRRASETPGFAIPQGAKRERFSPPYNSPPQGNESWNLQTRGQAPGGCPTPGGQSETPNLTPGGPPPDQGSPLDPRGTPEIDPNPVKSDPNLASGPPNLTQIRSNPAKSDRIRPKSGQIRPNPTPEPLKPGIRPKSGLRTPPPAISRYPLHCGNLDPEFQPFKAQECHDSSLVV